MVEIERTSRAMLRAVDAASTPVRESNSQPLTQRLTIDLMRHGAACCRSCR